MPLTDQGINYVESCILQLNDSRVPEISELRTLKNLQYAVRTGTAREKFPIGTVIPDLWIDHQTKTIYLMPLIIVDYRTVELATNHRKCPAAILLRQNALPGCHDFYESKFRFWLNDTSIGSDGYANGCSPNLLKTVSKIIIDEVPVKFFPPSLKELHFNPYDNPELEDLVWEYFRDTPTDHKVPCPKRIFLDPAGSPQIVWIRFEDFPCPWFVNSDGSACCSSVAHHYTCVPACAIT